MKVGKTYITENGCVETITHIDRMIYTDRGQKYDLNGIGLHDRLKSEHIRLKAGRYRNFIGEVVKIDHNLSDGVIQYKPDGTVAEFPSLYDIVESL